MAKTRPSPVPDLPDLYRYRNLIRYLPDWQNARAFARMGSTLPWLERMAKLEKDALALVMEGSGALNREELGRLAMAMEIPKADVTFFNLLGRFTFSTDIEVQRRALVRAVEILERRAEAEGMGPAFRARLHGYYFSIQVLAAQPDFQADPAWIASRLSGPVPLPALQRALDDLAALGGVREASVPRQIRVGVTATLADVLALDTHLAQAADLLRRDPYAPRFGTAHWAVYADVIPDVTGFLMGQGPAITERFGDPEGTLAVERVFRVHTVGGPLARHTGAP